MKRDNIDDRPEVVIHRGHVRGGKTDEIQGLTEGQGNDTIVPTSSSSNSGRGTGTKNEEATNL